MIDTSHLTELQIFACTLYGEARSEQTEGIIAVACVIRNRVHDPKGRWPKTYKGVCLQPWQFSCWKVEGGEGNHQKLAKLVADLKEGKATDNRYKECAWIATGVIHDWVRDIAYGADHYHVEKMAKKPKWAEGYVPLNHLHKFPRTSHLFYNLTPLVDRVGVRA
jgi:N-acetylmuramoyl-L-alanine amidase